MTRWNPKDPRGPGAGQGIDIAGVLRRVLGAQTPTTVKHSWWPMPPGPLNRPQAPVVSGGGAGRGGGHPSAGVTRLPPGPEERFGVGGALDAARSDIGAEFDAAMEQLKAQYRSQMAGIGAGTGAAIRDAQDMLRRVQANRAAVQEVYNEYRGMMEPIHQEAIDAAKALFGEHDPRVQEIADSAAEEIAAGFADAEASILAEASRIDASAGAAAAVAAEALQDQEAFEEQAAMTAEQASKLLGLQATAQERAAEAAQARDAGQIDRQALLMDTDFAQMEEQAQAALAAARRAAAQAAARRRALMNEQAAALRALEDERIRSMKLNPHEAGAAVLTEYMHRNAGNLPFNRQQLVFSTINNAIEQQVPIGSVIPWLQQTGLIRVPGAEGQGPSVLTSVERDMVSKGLQAYSVGMRHQQTQDNRNFNQAVVQSNQMMQPPNPGNIVGQYERSR